ncbi:putative signal transducing protein [Winogradskyella immobilis]|uniref:DUF2007 domain-containing protein n=1 Tax=Winogradskyella immobilis TaxID=2816852 RepID=A0ABS8EKA4_9FLAO|nr:DUF2007 domain-containing protein [Winogradskyella immobilis]MCC1483631.1 DUF2007 domain-containing protein [Winogradskyella immobilis]MCG0015725.1 DUF2007 domain-containing protein [Winogradskyella immobilis]
MSTTEYVKVYDGNFILVTRIKNGLEAIGIIPIIKDEGESQRLGGQDTLNSGYQEVYVNNEELNKAIDVVERVRAEMEISE